MVEQKSFIVNSVKSGQVSPPLFNNLYWQLHFLSHLRMLFNLPMCIIVSLCEILNFSLFRFKTVLLWHIYEILILSGLIVGLPGLLPVIVLLKWELKLSLLHSIMIPQGCRAMCVCVSYMSVYCVWAVCAHFQRSLHSSHDAVCLLLLCPGLLDEEGWRRRMRSRAVCGGGAGMWKGQLAFTE